MSVVVDNLMKTQTQTLTLVWMDLKSTTFILYPFVHFSFQVIRHDMYYVAYDQMPDDTWFQAVMAFRDEPNAELRLHVNGEVRQATARGTAYRGENTSGHVVIGRR